MGGLHHRHAGRGGRRGHNADRHAAELRAADRGRRGAGDEAGLRPGQRRRRRRLLGWRGARKPRGAARAARGGRVRLQVLPARLGCRGVPAAAARGARTGARRDRRARVAPDRARGGRRGDRPGSGRRRLPLRRLPRLPAAWRGEPGHRVAAGAGALDGGAHARAAPVELGRAAHARVGAPGRGRGDGRDLPALPDVHRRDGSGRGDPVQVLPADPGGGQPGAAVAGPGRRADRHRRVGPLAVDTGAQAARHRRLRRGLGRDLVAAAGADGDLVAGPGARAHAGRRRGMDGVGARGTGGADPQGPDHRRGGCGLLRVRAGRGVRGRPAPAAAPPPGDALPRAGAARAGAGDVAARGAGGPRRPPRRAARAGGGAGGS